MAQTWGERQDHHEHMIELERIASALERIADLTDLMKEAYEAARPTGGPTSDG